MSLRCYLDVRFETGSEAEMHYLLDLLRYAGSTLPTCSNESEAWQALVEPFANALGQ